MKIGYLCALLALAISSQVAAAELSAKPSPQQKDAGVMPDIATSDVADAAGKSGKDKAFQEMPIKATEFMKRGDLSALLPTLSARTSPGSATTRATRQC